MVQSIKPLWYRKDGSPIWPIMGGDGTDDGDGTPGGDGGDANLSLSPDLVRNTPEYRALLNENRKLARQKGTAETAAAAARAEAEEARQAAEASRQAELERQLVAVLGDDGVEAWAEIAELSSTDQVAAARRFAELMAAGKAQNQPPAQPTTPPPATPPADGAGEGEVPAATTPPPPPGRGVDGAAPLGQPSSGEDVQQVIADLQTIYKGVVERNQDPLQRNRVTMKDRAAGFISYLGAAYLQATGKNGR